jgi:hypothetical protein
LEQLGLLVPKDLKGLLDRLGLLGRRESKVLLGLLVTQAPWGRKGLLGRKESKARLVTELFLRGAFPQAPHCLHLAIRMVMLILPQTHCIFGFGMGLLGLTEGHLRKGLKAPLDRKAPLGRKGFKESKGRRV